MKRLVVYRITKATVLLSAAMLSATLLLSSCRKGETETKADEFSFAFLTDIHLQPELNATEGFRQAIGSVNELKPDFVITGGDLIMDALGVSFERADSLYDLYLETEQDFDMKVYNTLGNHEVFGYYSKSGVDSTHRFYGDKLYESRVGERYYAFNHKNWRFYILDSVEENEDGEGYYGYVDSEQMEWLKGDLANVDPGIPIALTVHIPLLTVQTQLVQGPTAPNGRGGVITNGKEILELFGDHNLKLVLQGHLHAYEDLYANGIHFITGGAVSGRWWQGPNRGTEEGFLLVRVKGDDISSEYIDFGWTVEEE